jgi:DNA-binding transcriptional MocR family regulator
MSNTASNNATVVAVVTVAASVAVAIRCLRMVRALENELKLHKEAEKLRATIRATSAEPNKAVAGGDVIGDDATAVPFSWETGPHFTIEAKARVPSDLRSLAPLMATPGVKFLAGGLPSPIVFPFVGFTATLQDGTVLEVSSPAELAACQQYARSVKSYDPLVEWVTDHVQALHSPPCPAGFEVCLSGGSTQATDAVARMLLDRGDACLCEAFTYSGTLTTLGPRGVRMVGVPCDAHGLSAGGLEALLSGWSASHPEVPKPRVLYTIPNGQNPSGTRATPERKAEVYACCVRHDIVIIE